MLTNKKLLLPLQCRLYTNLSPDCVKVIGCFSSNVNVGSSDTCVGPSYQSFLSTCTDELISTPEIMEFFP